MEKQNAINILKSRNLISTPGKYTVKVTSVTNFHKELAGGARQVAIMNVNAMTSYHQEAAKTLFGQGDYQEAVNQNLSASVRNTDYLPSKGEVIEIFVEEITTNNNVKGLFITSFNPVKAVAPSKIDLSSFLGESDSEERVDMLGEGETAVGANVGAEAFPG